MTFVVTQGAVVAPSLASYDVLQEDSARLTGVMDVESSEPVHKSNTW